MAYPGLIESEFLRVQHGTPMVLKVFQVILMSNLGQVLLLKGTMA